MKSLPLSVFMTAFLCWFSLTAAAVNPSITNDENLPLSCTIVDLHDVSCVGGLDGFVQVSASGGTFPYIYLWSNGMVGPINAALSAGVYTCTVTDIAGATATASATINEPPPLELSITAQVNIGCINATGSAEVAASGGTPPYAYSWSTGVTGPVATGLAAGIYIVSVSDANECIALQTIVITENLIPPLANAGPNLEINCDNPTVTLQGTGSIGPNFLALWTTTNGNILSGETTLNGCVVNAEGTYTLTITDILNGCSAISSCTVTEDLIPPAVSASVSANIDCLNATVTLDGSGSLGSNAGYLWTTVNGSIVSGETTLNDCIVDAAGTYTLLVTDLLNGCTASDGVTVEANLEIPAVSANVNAELSCLNATVTLDGSGSLGSNAGYLWTTVNGNIVSGATSLNDCVVDEPGTYTLLVTDLLNGCTASDGVTVEANLEIPAVSANVNAELSCLNATVTLDGSGSLGSNAGYLWTTLDGHIVSGANTLNDCVVDEPGTYTLLVTDLLNGCTASDGVTVEANLEIPAVSANVNAELSCLNATVTLDGTGSLGSNAGYLWTTLDGHIVSGANSLNDCVVDDPGTYVLLVTDLLNGCTASDGITVEANLEIPAVSASVNAELSCLNATVTLDGSGSLGSNADYLWTTLDGHIVSGANSLNDCVVDDPGTYVLLVTDLLNGCTASDGITVEANLEIPAVSASVNAELSCLNATVTLDGSGSLGSNAGYLWTTLDGHIVSGANSLNDCVVDDPGTYVLLVTDLLNGCTASDDVTVIINLDSPIAEAGVSVEINCLLPVAILNGIGSSAGANISYEWTTANGNIVSGANTLTPSVSAEGTYTLVVTDNDNGCTASDEVQVTAELNLPAANANVNGQLDCNTLSLTLDGSGSAVGANFTYEWNTTNGNIVSGANTLNDCLVDAPGEYTLIVTNSLTGCSGTANVVVEINANVPTASATVSGQIDCLNASVVIDGSASSQGNNFSYAWTTVNGNIVSGANTLMPEVNAAGTYTLTVSDNSNGCAATTSVTVTANLNLPTAEAGAGIQLDCINLTATLNGTGSSVGADISYEWTTVNGNISAGANTLTPTITAAGDYTLVVTNTSSGCTASDEVTVTANIGLPSASASVSAMIDCVNASVTLNGSGSSTGSNFAYLWTTVNGNIVSGETTLTDCIVNAAGDYTLVVTNTATGCTNSASVSVQANIDLPIAEAGVAVELTCLLPSVTLNGTGSSTGANFTYLWTTVNGNIVSGANTLNDCIVNAAGDYTLTVTNTLTGCSASDEVEVIISIGVPAASASVSGQLDCTNTSVALSGAGSSIGFLFSYQWTTTNGNIVSGANTLNDCVVDAAGNYTLTVTNTLTGCTNTASVEVVVNAEIPQASASVSGTLGCLNATVELDGAGSTTGDCFTALWTTSDGHIISGVNSLIAICDQPGTYTLTITNTTTGIAATASVTVLETAAVSVNFIEKQDVDCNGNASGSIIVSTSGGTAPYTYLWSNGATAASISGLTAGVYSVTATDANGCDDQFAVVISEPPVLQANVTVTNETALNANNGSAIAMPTGGNPPYQFAWSNGVTANGIMNAAPGTYTLTLTDQNGCQEIVTVVINPFECTGALQATANVTAETAFGANDGTAGVSVSGGVAPYAYLWSNGATSASVSGLAPGIYTVVVTDAQGCGVVVTVEVQPFGCTLTASVSTVNIGCGGAAEGSATVNVTGGSGNYGFLWSNGETSASVSGLTAGTYSVTVSAGDGCSAVLSAEITAGADVTPPVLTTQNFTVFLDENGQGSLHLEDILLNATDDCGEIDIEVDLPTADCDHPGEHIVTITATDEAGNTATATATVTIIDDIAPVLICPDDIIVNTCQGPIDYPVPGLIDNCSANSTVMNLVQGLCPGSIFPVGTTQVVYASVDPSGNITICTFTVTVETDIEISVSALAPSCAGFPDGTATVSISGVDPSAVSILWTDPTHQTTPTATGLTAGTYTVIVSGPEGCLLSQTVTVPAPPALAVKVDQIIQPNLPISQAGIKISASGGTPPYMFEWTRNSSFFSNQEDILGIPSGQYLCNVTDANGCTVWTEEIIIGLISLPDAGVLESLAEQVNIYPSPTTGPFFIELNLAAETEVQIELFDMVGKKFLTETKQVKQGKLSYDLTGIPSGKYLVEFRINGEKVVIPLVLTTW